MNNRTKNLITELNKREAWYEIFNNSNLNLLDKTDKRIRKRIRENFKPITQKSKYSNNKDFDFVIKKLARQILITEEIENEIETIGHTPDKDTKIIVKNLRQICTMLERET